MKNKFGFLASSLLLATAALCFAAILPFPELDLSSNKGNQIVKAGNSYSITLSSTNKYIDGNSKSVFTDANTGATVEFSYNNVSQSNDGHVVLNSGGSIRNINALTGISYFVPSFSLNSDASLLFRASNDGTNWGEYAAIKPITDKISVPNFSVPYMRYIEFKAEGGSVDINQLTFVYSCSESDVSGNESYECGTSFVDENIDKYTTNFNYSDLLNGLTVYKTYNGGSNALLDSQYYKVDVKTIGGVQIDTSKNFEAGSYKATIIRNDRAFADISYNFTVYGFNNEWSIDEEYHWHKCSNDTIVEINDKAEHTFDNGEITTEPTVTSEGVKTFTCSVCNYKKTESIPVISNFSFNNDINVPQSIHTTNQANFLNYSKDYYNITSSELNSYNAIGTAENSFPNQVTVTWNYDVPKGKTLSRYDFITGQKDDLSDGYKMTGSTAKSISFYNAFIGDNYFKVVAIFSDGSREESPIKIFKVEDIAPRNLKIGSMSNCRDMGGRTTIAGGRIKQGLIYRTSDPSGNVNDEVKEQMLNRFHLKTEIYVKDGGGSISPLGNSVTYYNCSMDYGATPYSNLTRNAERLRKVFSILGDANNYPAFYHCRIGTDRTGICGVSINGLLGVPFNEVIQDYAFSNFGKIDGQRYAHKENDTNGDDPAKYIDEILAFPGNNFQEQMTYALLSIGIPAQTLQNVIDILTEGPKVSIPNDITVANGSLLTNNGGTKKTTSDYTAPETYYEITGSSKSVSYNYNLSEAKDIDVICYLGCDNSSKTTKLADGIDLKIDGVSRTICDKTYFLAGFGVTGQAKRTGYMANLLGKYPLSAGNHTISIVGKNSDTFKIGGISLIGGPSNINATSSNIDVIIPGFEGYPDNPVDPGGGDNPGEEPEEGTPITLRIGNATGWNKETTKWNAKSGSDTKATWSIGSMLPAGTYKVSISCKMSSSSHSKRCFYNQSANDPTPNSSPDQSSEDPYRYWIEIGSDKFYPTNTMTWSDNGMSASSFTNVELISSLTIPANTTSITMVHGNIGYSLIIESVTFTPIS